MEEMPWIYIRARIKRIWVIAESSDSACSAFPILGVAAGSVRHANNWYRLGASGLCSVRGQTDSQFDGRRGRGQGRGNVGELPSARVMSLKWLRISMK